MKDDLISQSAAIQTAERMYKRCDTSSIEDYHDLLIEALTALPSAQPELNRKNLLRTMMAGILATSSKDAYYCGFRNGIRWCRALLEDKEPEYEEIPSAQPEEDCETCVHGHVVDLQCGHCRLAYQSNYERDETGGDSHG